MSSKSILSYFKEKTVNTVSDDVNVVDCTVSNDVNIEQTVDVTSEASSSGITSSLSASYETRELLFPEKPYHPPKDFIFPKSKFGARNRSCQHKWFETYQ